MLSLILKTIECFEIIIAGNALKLQIKGGLVALIVKQNHIKVFLQKNLI